MAQTINGIIARENYDEDFLSHINWGEFVKLAEELGCFIIGRKTYDTYQAKESEEYNFDNVKSKKIIVSRDKKSKLTGDYISASSPKDALNKASKLGFTKVLLTGGGTLNSTFMKDGLVDEIIINVEPYVLGRGIKIFSEATFENKLRLIEIKKLESGVVQLHYKIKNSARRPTTELNQ